MKYKLLNKVKELSRPLGYMVAAMGLLVLPGMVWAQPPPPTGSGGTGGGIPDSPLGVPFDNHLALLLMAAGAVLAVVVIVRIQKKKIIV